MHTFLGRGLTAAALLWGAFSVVPSQQGAPQTQRFPQFENDAAKVWKTLIMPGQPTSLHRHDHPRVIVALTAGTMEFVGQDGTKDRQVWEAGKAYWLPAMPPNTMHQDVNVGDKPVEVMVVELEKEK